MPDDLYDRDILAWSEHQASLLRRVARGERVNEVDWDHVIEEVEDVGLSELHSVESFLELILVHLLKIRISQDSDALDHWRSELVSFQGNGRRRFAPSMTQRIDVAELYRNALKQVAILDRQGRLADVPANCPFTVAQLLTEECGTLERQFQTTSSPS
jgi:hypothetical protein